MDLHIEFSAQFERDRLHRTFIRTLRTVFYLALCGVFGLAFFSDGGNDARTLPFFLLAAFLALTCELLATAKRLERGALLTTGFILFLPWIVFQALSAAFLSPMPGNAALACGMNLVPLLLFFFAQQHSRTSGAQTRLLAATLVLLIVGLVAGITYQIQLEKDFSGSLAQKIFSGFLSDPAAAGGSAILILFASSALVFRRSSDSRKRLLALYTGLVALCLILLTRNTAIWLATLAGGIVFVSLQARRKTLRSALIILLACGIAVAPIFSDLSFKTPPAIASIQKREKSDLQAPSRVDLQKLALGIFAEHPVLGAGTASFKSEFRKVAPPQWQFSAKTSNNLYTFVLAENGIVGFLLLFVPAGFILFCGIRTCRMLPHRHEHSRRASEEKIHNANTRSLLASLIGGATASAVLFAFDFSPSFLPVILGISVFGGIIMHETGPSAFSRIRVWSGKRRKIAFVVAALLPAGIFALLVPASYSAAQCETGKRAMAPFLQDFYGNANLTTQNLNPETVETPLLAAVSTQPNNADAWVELARFYSLAAYSNPEFISEFARAMNHAATRALETAPEFADAHLYNAVSEIMLGEKERARESLELAVRLAPNDIPLLFQVAEAHRMLSNQKNPPDAILKRLKQLAPASPRVRQMDAIVDLTSQSKDEDAHEAQDDASSRSLFEI